MSRWPRWRCSTPPSATGHPSPEWPSRAPSLAPPSGLTVSSASLATTGTRTRTRATIQSWIAGSASRRCPSRARIARRACWVTASTCWVAQAASSSNRSAAPTGSFYRLPLEGAGDTATRRMLRECLVGIALGDRRGSMSSLRAAPLWSSSVVPWHGRRAVKERNTVVPISGNRGWYDGSGTRSQRVTLKQPFCCMAKIPTRIQRGWGAAADAEDGSARQ